MAMRLVEQHGVSLTGAVSAAATGVSLFAVQLLGEGGAIAAGVALLGALVTAWVATIRQQRASFRAQVEAQSAELAAARARITELEHRVDELTAMLLARP